MPNITVTIHSHHALAHAYAARTGAQLTEPRFWSLPPTYADASAPAAQPAQPSER